MIEREIISEITPIALLSEVDDINKLSLNKISAIYFAMHLINSFEHALIELQKKENLWGPLHTSLGVEASAASAIAALEKRDRINGTHRGHHQVLSKGLYYYTKEEWNPLLEDVPAPLTVFTRKVFAEILGLKSGLCGGRGGSMHLYHPEAGIHGTNGIVGGGIPSAAGLSLAAQYLNKDEVTVSFFGDGACNQGTFHETLNIASAWKLPVIFFIENNLYAVSTRTSESSAVNDFALRGHGYHIPSQIVYGYDPVGTYLAMKKAVEFVRCGNGPFLIESKCYRPVHHDSLLPGSSYGYRTKEEEEEWRKKEAFSAFPRLIMDQGLMTAKEIKVLNRKAKQLVDEALRPLLRDDGSDLKEELWPEPETAAEGVRSDGREFSDIRFMTSVPGGTAKPMKFSRIISEITGLWMEKDPTVLEWGEDIASFRKGPYGACDGLVPRFPGRIRNTPISESAFSGMALGAAMNGLKPIVEIMFPDFVLVAADQLFNQIGKARHMYGNTDIDLPLIFRTRIATGTGMGPQHSMDPASLFSLFPGWRIIAPSNGMDYIGLFNTAMVSKDPVLILEHQLLYNRKFPTPENWDYYIPFGEASTIRTGSDITMISYGGMIGKCTEAAAALEKDGRSCEILDLRTIDPEGIDYECIGRSLKKTGLAVIAEENVTSQSLGFRIGSSITERFWDILRKPPLRITSIDAPVPTCKTIEQEIICDTEDITKQIRQWMV